MNRFLALMIFVACTLLVGCAIPKYSISVDSRVGDPEYTAPGRKYAILPANKDVNLNDLEFREFSSYVAKALQQKGFAVVPSSVEADVVVFLGYGISEPKSETVTYAQPVFGQTGVQSSTTYGTYNSGSGTFSSTTYNTPTYGVTGYVPITATHTYFIRKMLLVAYALENRGKDFKLDKQAWRIIAVSVGGSGDLRVIFPVLVFAAKDYFGADSQRAVTLEVKETDKDLAEFSGKTPQNSFTWGDLDFI